jgi:hypothetical protein
MKSTVLNLARRARDAISRNSEKNLLLTGRLLCLNIREITRVNSLADVEFRVYSQGGEDGIIEGWWKDWRSPLTHLLNSG